MQPPTPPLSVAESWSAIHAYLRKREPGACKQFEDACGPISGADLAAFERNLGVPLPADLKESLLLHDLRTPLAALSIFGYSNSSQRMFVQYRNFLQGPLMTRFSDTETQDAKSFRGGFYGCMPLSTYDEDRTYFYLMIDLIRGCVFYLDYGDLVGDPAGRIIAWDFRSYLSTIARLLSSDNFVPFHKRWPEMQFGFNGLSDILDPFPARRKLVIPESDGFMADIPDYQNVVLREAYAAPNAPQHQVPRLPPPASPPDVIPSDLHSRITEIAFLSDLRWDLEGVVPPVLLGSPDGKRVRAESVRSSSAGSVGGLCATRALQGPGIYYFEVLISAAMSVSVGLLSKHPTTPHTTMAITVARGCVNLCKRGGGTSSCSLVHFEGDEEVTRDIRSGDIIGILLDLSDPVERKISVYRNRQVVLCKDVILKSDFVNLDRYVAFLPFVSMYQAEVAFLSFEERLGRLTGKKRSREDAGLRSAEAPIPRKKKKEGEAVVAGAVAGAVVDEELEGED